MYSILECVRNELAWILGIKTCRIGVENSLSPDDYPIIRIVPQRISPASVLCKNQYVLQIYFGMPVSESDNGLEAVYASLSDLSESIIMTMQTSTTFSAIWQETLLDEDRVDKYKLGMARFLVEA